MKKENLIVFPHRVAPEKQVEIFRDIAKHLTNYQFIVCQDQSLSKDEYHNILGRAKLVFSCSLQETLGIGCYEGALVNAIPLVPDRLSYTEMYFENFKYPSRWTENFDSYKAHRIELFFKITQFMENYEKFIFILEKQASALTEYFFSANSLVENFK